MDSGDGFTVDNRESKISLRSDRGPPTLPLYPPLHALSIITRAYVIIHKRSAFLLHLFISFTQVTHDTI